MIEGRRIVIESPVTVCTREENGRMVPEGVSGKKADQKNQGEVANISGGIIHCRSLLDLAAVMRGEVDESASFSLLP